MAGTGSTLYLILTQVVSRGLTFAGNQALLRYVTPRDLGLAVQLEALSVSILYTARESLRVALQRDPKIITVSEEKGSSRVNHQAAVNATSLVVVLGFLIGIAVGTVYLRSAGSTLRNAQDFQIIFSLYAAGTFLELLSESGFIIVQQNGLFRTRALAETTAAIMRCLGAVFTALYMRHQGFPMSARPFAMGQLCYAITLLMLYLVRAGQVARTTNFSLTPRMLESSDAVLSLVPRNLLRLAGAFYGQSIFKWLLTQGDTLFLSYFADLQSQGIFALASNYGGLVSRLLFQPVEESSRIQFGQLLSDHVPGPGNESSTAAKEPVVQRRQKVLQQLARTVRGYVIIILVPCTTLLPLIFPVVVSILLGSRSTFNTDRTAFLLSAYSHYLPFLAINGILDAFVTSIATEAELAEQSIAMAGVTVLYLSAAVGMMNHLGLAETGLVYANILNMALRICFSMWYIRAWVQGKFPVGNRQAFGNFLGQCMPNRTALGTWVGLQVLMLSRMHVKRHIRNRIGLEGYSDTAIPGTGLDLFDASYILSAGVILLSGLITSEQDFLLESIREIMPRRIQRFVPQFLQLDTTGDSRLAKDKDS